MPHEFDRLNKYERAYIRSQIRKLRKKNKAHKQPWWSFLKRFFTLQGWKDDFYRRRNIITVDAHNSEDKQKDPQPVGLHRRQRLFQGIHDMPGANYVNEQVQHMKKTLKTKKHNSWWNPKNLFFIVGSIFLFVLIIFGIWFTTLEMPDVSNFEQRKISNSTKIYDRTGEILLYDIHENISRTVVDIEDINQYAKDAIVAIEDHTFYEHNGVVVKSTARAVLQTILSKLGLSNEGTAGGSTLTQQVVKNTLLNSRQLISRKVKEWVLAYKIEQRLTKDQILEIYLNEAPYGGTIYGIQEASRVFFGTSAAELTLGQAAYLAAIPNLPTFYSPYGPNKDLLDERQRVVLGEMKRYGYITDEEYRDALAEEVEFLSQEENRVKALHFVQYIRAYLEEQYGSDLVENGGLKVITTLDYELQEKAERFLKEHIEEVEDDFNASNAALVAIESETGHIITMVGSRDYFDEEIDGNFNVALARRQPGSSFKPIAYANAFEQGYLPETAIFDVKTQFSGRCPATNLTSNGGCYSPSNYDGEFKGPMSLRNALAQSRNIPAVKVLYLGGLQKTMDLARELGINSLNEQSDFYGLGLVLGGGEVSLLELTGAYSVFANDGELNKPTGIISIEDSEGNVLEKYQKDEQRVISRNSARMISSILSDNVARTPLFGSQSFLYFGERDVAGKTGTTNDNRDAWLVGYTSEVAVGVWTGNNDNTPMKKGSSISGKPWRAFMDEVIDKYGTDNFEGYDLPEDFDNFPPVIRGSWDEDQNGNFNPHTILHWIDKNNPLELDISTDDPQYENWEYAVSQYVRTNFVGRYSENDNNDGSDNQGQEDETPSLFKVEIRGIDEGEEFETGDTLRVTIAFDGIDIDDVERVDFYINNKFIESDDSQPFNTRIDIDDVLEEITENNILEVVATNDTNQTVSQQVTFIFNSEE